MNPSPPLPPAVEMDPVLKDARDKVISALRLFTSIQSVVMTLQKAHKVDILKLMQSSNVDNMEDLFKLMGFDVDQHKCLHGYGAATADHLDGPKTSRTTAPAMATPFAVPATIPRAPSAAEQPDRSYVSTYASSSFSTLQEPARQMPSASASFQAYAPSMAPSQASAEQEDGYDHPNESEASRTTPAPAMATPFAVPATIPQAFSAAEQPDRSYVSPFASSSLATPQAPARQMPSAPSMTPSQASAQQEDGYDHLNESKASRTTPAPAMATRFAVPASIPRASFAVPAFIPRAPSAVPASIPRASFAVPATIPRAPFAAKQPDRSYVSPFASSSFATPQAPARQMPPASASFQAYPPSMAPSQASGQQEDDGSYEEEEDDEFSNLASKYCKPSFY